MVKRSRPNAIGKRKLRWAEHHKLSRETVERRALGRCEVCRERGTDWAHLFQRGNVISEPLCSMPFMTTLLCRSCHDRLDQRVGHDTVFQERARWNACHRAIEALWPGTEIDGPMSPEALGVMGSARAIERAWKPTPEDLTMYYNPAPHTP